MSKQNGRKPKTQEEIKKDKEEAVEALAGIRKMHGETMRKVDRMSGRILFNDRG